MPPNPLWQGHRTVIVLAVSRADIKVPSQTDIKVPFRRGGLCPPLDGARSTGPWGGEGDRCLDPEDLWVAGSQYLPENWDASPQTSYKSMYVT